MIVLASRSPQRRALLGAMGVELRVAASRFPEGRDAVANARGKAREVASRLGVPPGGAVLGADTEVVLDGTALGKPADRAEAGRMLRALGGRAHEVHTAVALVRVGAEDEALARTVVRFRHLGGAEVEWYLGRGEWPERAGAYAIQGAGAALVERIEGDYTAVVGLPVPTVARLLSAAGLAPWSTSRSGSG